jgi:hypothetical protein
MWAGWTPVPDCPGGRASYADPGSGAGSVDVTVRGSDGSGWLWNGRWNRLGVVDQSPGWRMEPHLLRLATSAWYIVA